MNEEERLEARKQAEQDVMSGFASLFLIVGYGLAVALVRYLLFDVFPRLPEHFWGTIYWFVAGAIFQQFVSPKIKGFWK